MATSEATSESTLAGIVLAAGVAQRFGSDKRRAVFPRTGDNAVSDDSRHTFHSTLLAATIASVEPFCAVLFVALKPEDEPIVPELLGPWATHPKIRLCFAPHAHEGMGSSLSDAMDSLTRYSETASQANDGVMILLGDMPFVKPQTFTELLAARASQSITFPCYAPPLAQVDATQNQRQNQWQAEAHWGHPVVFGADWFAALQQLKGDQGARKILRANPQACRPVQVDDPGVCRDIDRPEDLSINR